MIEIKCITESQSNKLIVFLYGNSKVFKLSNINELEGSNFNCDYICYTLRFSTV